MHHCSLLSLMPGLPQKNPGKAGGEQRRGRGEEKRAFSFCGDKPNLLTPSGSEERGQGCWDVPPHQPTGDPGTATMLSLLGVWGQAGAPWSSPETSHLWGDPACGRHKLIAARAAAGAVGSLGGGRQWHRSRCSAAGEDRAPGQFCFKSD